MTKVDFALEVQCWKCGRESGYRYEPEPHELRGPGCGSCDGKGGRPTDGNYILDSLAGVMYIGDMKQASSHPEKERLAEAEANWNCRGCGHAIVAEPRDKRLRAVVLFVDVRRGAVLERQPRRWHSFCLDEANKRLWRNSWPKSRY